MLAKVHAFHFVFKKFEAILCGPFVYFDETVEVGILLCAYNFINSKLKKSATYRAHSVLVFIFFTILFIFMLTCVIDKMFPCGLPISYSLGAKKILPLWYLEISPF